MTSKFAERLEAARVLVADGATGTNYQLMGLKPGQPPEEWLFEEPDKVKELHRRFIEAGSDIILTNSFGGNPVHLKGGLHSSEELNRRAAELAGEVAAEAPRSVLVAGSMGPTGQLLKPIGPLPHDEAREGYARQAAALARSGVDLLVIETMFDLTEATLAVEGVRQASDLPLVCSFSFDRRGSRTMMGVGPLDVVRAFQGAGLAAVGLNCGRSIEDARQVLEEMAQALQGQQTPLWCKPNAGKPRLEGGITRYDLTPQQMGGWALEFIRLGARIIGGCCGTQPEHIAAIASTVAQYRGQPA